MLPHSEKLTEELECHCDGGPDLTWVLTGYKHHEGGPKLKANMEETDRERLP